MIYRQLLVFSSLNLDVVPQGTYTPKLVYVEDACACGLLYCRTTLNVKYGAYGTSSLVSSTDIIPPYRTARAQRQITTATAGPSKLTTSQASVITSSTSLLQPRNPRLHIKFQSVRIAQQQEASQAKVKNRLSSKSPPTAHTNGNISPLSQAPHLNTSEGASRRSMASGRRTPNWIPVVDPPSCPIFR